MRNLASKQLGGKDDAVRARPAFALPQRAQDPDLRWVEDNIPTSAPTASQDTAFPAYIADSDEVRAGSAWRLRLTAAGNHEHALRAVQDAVASACVHCGIPHTPEFTRLPGWGPA